jgi:hypothetical protein
MMHDPAIILIIFFPSPRLKIFFLSPLNLKFSFLSQLVQHYCHNITGGVAPEHFALFLLLSSRFSSLFLCTQYERRGTQKKWQGGKLINF